MRYLLSVKRDQILTKRDDIYIQPDSKLESYSLILNLSNVREPKTVICSSFVYDTDEVVKLDGTVSRVLRLIALISLSLPYPRRKTS